MDIPYPYPIWEMWTNGTISNMEIDYINYNHLDEGSRSSRIIKKIPGTPRDFFDFMCLSWL
jgi:hypothetical protein